MLTPYDAGELSDLGNTKHSARWKLAVHQPLTLVVVELDNESWASEGPTYQVTYSTVTSGTESLAEADMTVLLGTSSGGRDLGVTRLRHDLAGDGTMDIAEEGYGNINWEGAGGGTIYATVIEERRPWIKHPFYNTGDDTWRYDYDQLYNGEFTDGTEGAYAIMGPPIVAVLDGGSVDIDFVGERSFAIGSASIVSAVWQWHDGTSDNNLGTFASPVQKTFSTAIQHGRYVKLTVIDSTARQHTGYRLIFIYDSWDDAIDINFGNVSGSIQEGGYKSTITFTDHDHDVISKGTECVIFETDTLYGSNTDPIGGNFPTRENIVFRGWAMDESMRVDPFSSVCTIMLGGMHKYLGQATAYDVFHKNTTGTPNDPWIEANNLTVDLTAIDIIKHRSTAGDLCDFRPAGGIAGSETIAYQSLPRSTWWQQLQTNYGGKGILGWIAFDAQGSLYAGEDIIIAGTEGSYSSIMSFDTGRVTNGVVLQMPEADRNAMVRLYAVSGETPLGAESPGKVAGYFGGLLEITRGLVADTIDTLKTWASNYRAKLNNDYPLVTLPLFGNNKLDCVPMCIVDYTLADTANARGISFSSDTFIPTSSTWTYSADTFTVTTSITMMKHVSGWGAEEIEFPEIEDITPIEQPPPESPPNPTGQRGDPLGGLYIQTKHYIMYTPELSAASPTWYVKATSGDIGEIYDFAIDPWRPLERAFATTDQGVWRFDINVADSAKFNMENVQTVSEIEAATNTGYQHGFKILLSINFDNWVGFGFNVTSVNDPTYDGDTARDAYFGRSTDGGDNWSYYEMWDARMGTGFPNTRYHRWWYGAMDYVPHAVGGDVVLYATGYNNRGTSYTIGRTHFYKSTDGGATWSRLSSSVNNANVQTSVVHAPYMEAGTTTKNDSGNHVVIRGFYGSSTWGYFASDDGGSTLNVLDSTNLTTAKTQDSLSGDGHYMKRWGFEFSTQDANYCYAWIGDIASGYELWVSSDGGANFTHKNTTSGTITGRLSATGGWPYDLEGAIFYVLTTDGVWVSIDGADTWMEKTGNLTATQLGSTVDSSTAWHVSINKNDDANLGYHPFGTIVPVWVS